MESTKKTKKTIKKSVTFHGINKKKKKAMVGRESVLKPSVYQKIQKKRKSQMIAPSIDNMLLPNNKDIGTKPMKRFSLCLNNMKIDTRRTVFVSLRGFNECWRWVQPHILFDCILILPLYREWIITPTLYKHSFNDILSDSKFLTLLQWKEKQGLVFFMFNTNDNKAMIEHKIKNQNNTGQNEIAPFWYNLSNKLQDLYDPDTCDSYRPLLLNQRWWKYAYSNKQKTNCLYYSKYGVSSEDVLNELMYLTMKYKTIQEILYQSNPSLNVLITYDENSRSSYSASPMLQSMHIQHQQPMGYITRLSLNSPINTPESPHITAIKSILNEKKLTLNDSNDSNESNDTLLSSPHRKLSKLSQLDQCEEEDIEIEPTPDIAGFELNASDLENMDNNYLSSSSSDKIINSMNSSSDNDIDDKHYNDKSSSSEESASSSAMFANIKKYDDMDHDMDDIDDIDDIDDMDECIKNIEMEQIKSSKRKSYDSQSTVSRKQTLDDMEWWVCPDYYYDTIKNKIDTDCDDTDY